MVKKKEEAKLSAISGLELQAPRSNLNLTTAEIRPSLSSSGCMLNHKTTKELHDK